MRIAAALSCAFALACVLPFDRMALARVSNVLTSLVVRPIGGEALT